MRFAVIVECSGAGEGCFPGLSRSEGKVRVAVFIVTFEHSVVRCQLVVDKLDGIAGLNGDGGWPVSYTHLTLPTIYSV